ncbi:MAG: hypothetical protein Kow0067_12570 [Coriobacteriia bacterium]
MKQGNRIVPGALVAVGVAVAVVPQVTKCATHMAGCAGTAQAEIIVGVGIALSGLVILLAATPVVRIIAASVAEVFSFVAIALPLFITGTCGMEMMRCNVLLRPSTIVLGVVSIGLSLALLLAGVKDLKLGRLETAE